MNSPKTCDLERVNEEKSEEFPEFSEFSDRKYVDLLLDISEEPEQEAYELQNKILCTDAIQGWGLSPPLSCLFQMPKRGRKPKPDVTDAHCILCAELKRPELPLSQRTCRTSDVSEVSLKSSIPIKSDHPKGDASSVLVEKTSDLTVQNRNIPSDTLGNKVPLEGEEQQHEKSPPQPLKLVSPSPLLNDSDMEKGTNVSQLNILPPVTGSAPGNPKNGSYLKGRAIPEVFPPEGIADCVRVASRPSASGEKATEKDKKKVMVLPYLNSVLDTFQGSLSSEHLPTHYQYHLLSTFNIRLSKRTPVSINAVTDTQHRATSIPWSKHPLRQNSGHRQRLNHRTNNLRRAKPELPMLFGTRVPKPAYTHHLL